MGSGVERRSLRESGNPQRSLRLPTPDSRLPAGSSHEVFNRTPYKFLPVQGWRTSKITRPSDETPGTQESEEAAVVGRRYRVIIEQDEDGIYVATAPALPGVVEQGDTVDEAFENMGATMRFTLDSMIAESEELPPSDAPDSKEIHIVELVV